MLADFFKKNILIAVTFFFLFLVSDFIFSINSNIGNLIFLPNAVRVIAVLIGGWAMLPGLILGHVMAGFLNEPNILLIVVGSICPFLAFYILKITNVLDLDKLYNIKFEQIIFFVFFTSFFNAVGSYFVLSSDVGIGTVFITRYFVGDFFGAIIGLYIFLKLFKVK
jgi:hypothetical protein